MGRKACNRPRIGPAALGRLARRKISYHRAGGVDTRAHTRKAPVALILLTRIQSPYTQEAAASRRKRHYRPSAPSQAASAAGEARKEEEASSPLSGAAALRGPGRTGAQASHAAAATMSEAELKAAIEILPVSRGLVSALWVWGAWRRHGGSYPAPPAPVPTTVSILDRPPAPIHTY